MNIHFLIGITGICLLVVWAIAATIVAIKEHTNYENTFSLLRIAYAGLDNCFSYCGNPGSWVDTQKQKVADLIVSILQSQSRITCDNPAVGFPTLAQCAAVALSQTYSYWTIVDPSNRASGTALMMSAVSQCIASGQGSGCKVQA